MMTDRHRLNIQTYLGGLAVLGLALAGGCGDGSSTSDGPPANQPAVPDPAPAAGTDVPGSEQTIDPAASPTSAPTADSVPGPAPVASIRRRTSRWRRASGRSTSRLRFAISPAPARRT